MIGKLFATSPNGTTRHIRHEWLPGASSEIANAASRKLTWLSAMIGFGPAFFRLSRPCTSSR